MEQEQVVAEAQYHAETLFESDITHGEQLGIGSSADKKYRKCEFNVRDVELINKHLEGAREATYEKAEVSVTAKNVKIYVAKKYDEEIRSMVRKHEDTCHIPVVRKISKELK